MKKTAEDYAEEINAKFHQSTSDAVKIAKVHSEIVLNLMFGDRDVVDDILDDYLKQEGMNFHLLAFGYVMGLEYLAAQAMIEDPEFEDDVEQTHKDMIKKVGNLHMDAFTSPMYLAIREREKNE